MELHPPDKWCQPCPDIPHHTRGKIPGRRPSVRWQAVLANMVSHAGPVRLGEEQIVCVYLLPCVSEGMSGMGRLRGHVSVRMVRRRTMKPLCIQLFSQGCDMQTHYMATDCVFKVLFNIYLVSATYQHTKTSN